MPVGAAEACRMAAEVIREYPERWVQGDYAVDPEGRPLVSGNPRATCACGVGMVVMAAGGFTTEIRQLLAERVRDLDPLGDWENFEEFNDWSRRKPHQVADMLDRIAEGLP